MKLNLLSSSLFLSLTVLLSSLANAQTNRPAYDPKNPLVTGHEVPKDLEELGVDENLGGQLDLSLPFVSDTGDAVTLGQYFNGTKPVLMAMVYYTCPSLCNHHLNALNDAMKQLEWSAGDQFDVVAISMNHREGPEVAAAKKQSYIKDYGRPESAKGWHFLTGTEENVAKIADQFGFKFRWIEDQEQYAHAAVAYVTTPGGQISRYLYGLGVEPGTLRMSLLEASNGKIGSVMDQILMFCLQFDPAKNKYTLYAWNLMRLGGGLILLVLAVLLVPMWLREKKSQSVA